MYFIIILTRAEQFKTGKEGAGKDSGLCEASQLPCMTALLIFEGRKLRWKDFKVMPVTELVPEPRSLTPQLASLIALLGHLSLGPEML